MTPAIALMEKSRLKHRVHEYSHDPSAASYGLEAAQKTGADPERVFKTLVVKLDGKTLAVGIVPVTATLNMKRMAKVLGAKKAAMAEPAEVERTTGYVLGGVSPLGQKKRLKTAIDAGARNFPTIYVSAGRRGLELELAPGDLCALVEGVFAAIAGP